MPACAPLASGHGKGVSRLVAAVGMRENTDMMHLPRWPLAGEFLRFAMSFFLMAEILIFPCNLRAETVDKAKDATWRVFIFAGQSNMVGSDSRLEDIQRFPPFHGLERPQEKVRFAYCIGRENKMRSDGWVDLQAVDGVVGPELSFARKVSGSVDAPLAIIKCAAGGTHLGGDWNPDQPSGFEMYPLMLDLVQSSLDLLDQQGISYRLEGFMWHQGENDMFEASYMARYGDNLAHFLQCLRRDLKVPDLRCYLGELCTKTIWGMDLRPRMHAISLGQKQVAREDPLTQYVQTSHIGVEIGHPVGLHYHYGTLGQLQHGVNYADAYLGHLGQKTVTSRTLTAWPYPPRSRVKLFILAGHRNMEGERAFIQDLQAQGEGAALLDPIPEIAFRYHLGGGYRQSSSWEPLGPVDYYDTFGPELSFARKLHAGGVASMAIAKFTHSGSQVIDWTPEGSEAKSRNLYPAFIDDIQAAMRDLEDRGHQVSLEGIFYHVGENDMSMGHYRRNVPSWLASIIRASRQDLGMPALRWFISQQPPTDHPDLNAIDVVSELESMDAGDPNIMHIKVFDLPGQERLPVITTAGIVRLGELLGGRYLETSGQRTGQP